MDIKGRAVFRRVRGKLYMQYSDQGSGNDYDDCLSHMSESQGGLYLVRHMNVLCSLLDPMTMARTKLKSKVRTRRRKSRTKMNI